jgi:alpha-D-ribose 1-methylphosphonate 5-triphosphate diphosphatase PhnM
VSQSVSLSVGAPHAGSPGMSKVVNLNKFRKQLAKRERVKQAETNRRLHGRTKAERAADALQKKKLTASVDQARLEHIAHEDDEPTPEGS